jgi:hypothetical protein
MGFYFAGVRPLIGDEPSASTTWREYVEALSGASESGAGGHALGGSGSRLPGDRLTRPGRERAGSAARSLENALEVVRRRARKAFGLTDTLQLQCEAAALRLLLIQLYTSRGERDRAGALARETQAVL